MVEVDEAIVNRIGGVLLDKNRPLKERFRALFTLKNIGGRPAVECINAAFGDDSALLKHEAAYCLGQMQDEIANKYLLEVLHDKTQEPIVRHEAAEAIGAIASPEMKTYLEQYADDECREVRETCQLALGRLQYIADHPGASAAEWANDFNSVDPAPPLDSSDVDELARILGDHTCSLFDRYRAMFALRNMSTPLTTEVLCEALRRPKEGALFKHEIAFVLGQMQLECAAPALIAALRDTEENAMVRHECAEALGAIATRECRRVLRSFLDDPKRVVRESCVIALDMCEYENSPEFQYANTLQNL